MPWNIFIDQNQRGQNVLGMFLAGGARGAQGQMPSKMLSEEFFPLKPKGPEHFRDVSGRGGPGSQGQMPSKRKPDFFLLEAKRPEHFSDVSGREGGQGGPGPDASKKVAWNIVFY